MENISDINRSFIETIRASDLKDISIDTAENFIDGFLKDSLLKDLPIVGSIIGIGKLITNIKDVLFLKKMIAFLAEVKKVSIIQRQKVIDEVNNSDKYKTKIGEKLIYIIDKCDDHLVAKYVAQFFTAFLEEKITYDEFLRGSRIIQNILVADLEYFISTDVTEFETTGPSEELPHEDQFSLINAGICGFGYDKVHLREANLMTRRKHVEGGDAVVWITSIGKKLKDILIKEE